MNQMIQDEVQFPNCDTQALNLIGEIQSVGALLIIDPTRHTIDYCSGNINDFIRATHEQLLGTLYRESLPTPLVEHISQSLRNRQNHNARLTQDGLPEVFVSTQYENKQVIVELEMCTAKSNAFHEHERYTIPFMSCNDEDQLIQMCLDAVDDLLKLDRTMIYRFEPDKSGVVIAERNRHFEDDYLNLRFPASDIPENARRMYYATPLRVIFDRTATSVPLYGHEALLTADLTQATLRGVADVHRKYLEHMDVVGSLSIPIMIQDELWGLVSCHHASTLPLSPTERNEVLALVDAFCNRMRLLKVNTRMRFMDFKEHHISGLAEQLFQHLRKNDQPDTELLQGILALTQASGLAVLYKGQWLQHGVTPVDHLGEFLRVAQENGEHNGFFSTDCCGSVEASLEAHCESASGMIGIWNALNEEDDKEKATALLWFKPELERMVEWGGQPKKKSDNIGLSPRSSFNAWRELMHFHSGPWGNMAELGARAFLTDLKKARLDKASNPT